MIAKCNKCGATAPAGDDPDRLRDIREGVVKLKACAHGPALLVETPKVIA